MALNKKIDGILPALLLVGLGLIAFLIRYQAVSYGLPLLLYEDEPIYFHHALGFGLGNWVIDYFKKPPFFLQFYAFFYGVFGYFNPVVLNPIAFNWQHFVDAFWQDPSQVAIIGRTVSVALAAGTVVLTGLIGRQLSNWAVGLAAAFFMLVDVTHLKISAVVISDIPSLFCILLTTLFALRLLKTGCWQAYLLCAFGCGLSMSMKYNVFCVALLLSAHCVYTATVTDRSTDTKTSTQGQWLRRLLTHNRLKLLTALGFVGLTFLALNSSILFNFNAFLGDLLYERRHMLAKNPNAAVDAWVPMVSAGKIFLKIIPENIGWLIYVFSWLGLILAVREKKKAWLVALSFPVVFLLVLCQFKLINAKYMLPVFPYFYCLAAFALVFVTKKIALWQINWLQKKTAFFNQQGLLAGLLVLIVPLAVCWSIFLSGRHLALTTKTDTRNLAAAYLNKTLQPELSGQSVLLEPETLTLNPRVIRKTFQLSVLKNGHWSPQPFAEKALLNAFSLDQPDDWPDRVVVNLGMAKKMKTTASLADKKGLPAYRMPYTPAYYEHLKKHYVVKKVFLPVTAPLTISQFQNIVTHEGVSEAYRLIRQNGSKRVRPGPFLLVFALKQ
ncbi:MAG: glycosyltransferase family 39 protein [Cyanobacteria bacterium P01_H01_bin.74]